MVLCTHACALMFQVNIYQDGVSYLYVIDKLGIYMWRYTIS